MKNNAWWALAHRLKDYIHPERWLIITSICTLLLATGARLLKPLPLAFVIDYILVSVVENVDKADGIVNNEAAVDDIDFDTSVFEVSLSTISNIDNQYLLLAAAGSVVLIALLMAGLSFSSTLGLSLAGSRILTSVRNDLFAHLQRLSLRFHMESKSGDLTMRLINDIAMLREATVTALMPMLANIFILLGMFGVMFYFDWKLTLIAILSLPLLFITTKRSGKKIHETSRVQRKREGSLASKANEYIGSIRTIQSLSLEKEVIRSFSGDNTESRKQDVKTKRLTAGLERRVDVLVAFVTAVILFQGANAVLAGTMSPGELVIFMSYLNNSFRPVREYAKYTARLSKALAAGERVVDLLDEQPDIQDRPNAKKLKDVRGDIEFEHVAFGYRKKDKDTVPILRDMNFKINAGESVAIVGPSGAGKTTITSLLLRLYEPNGGTVKIDGKDIRNFTMASVRKQVAMVPQDNLLFGLSIRENIALGAANRLDDITDEEIVEAAKLAKAHDFIMALPEGYDTILSERGGSLSGGQRQRIAVARAAVNKSSILILDEPTVGLDRENEHFVISALKDLMKGRTTIMITHDLNFAATADKILFVNKGMVAEQGPHDVLLAKNGQYAEWWKMQVN